MLYHFRFIRLFSLASAVLFLSGCFELEQSIDLKPNGNLEFSFHYIVPETYMPAFTQFHQTMADWQEADPDSTWLLNKKAVTDQFPGDIFKITRYNVFSKNGSRHIIISGKAKAGDKALNSGALGTFELRKLEDDTVRLTLSLPRLEKTLPRTEKEKQAMLAATRGLSLKLIIKTPEPIQKTNGKKTGRKEVQWEYGPELPAHPEILPKELFVTF